MHSVLQAHYDGRQDSTAVFDAIMAEQAELPQFDLKLFEAMIEGYFDWLAETGADAYLTPIMVEEKVEVYLGNIEGKSVTLHGTIDLLHSNPDQQLILMDHKTCASFEALANRRMQLSFQLQTYAYLVERHLGQAPVLAIYNMLRKVKRTGTAKPPFFRREPVHFNAYQRANFERQLRTVVRDMLRKEEETLHLGDDACVPVVDQDCSWKCSFFNVCAMKDDGSDIDGALNTLYVRSDRA